MIFLEQYNEPRLTCLLRYQLIRKQSDRKEPQINSPLSVWVTVLSLTLSRHVQTLNTSELVTPTVITVRARDDVRGTLLDILKF